MKNYGIIIRMQPFNLNDLVQNRRFAIRQVLGSNLAPASGYKGRKATAVAVPLNLSARPQHPRQLLAQYAHQFRNLRLQVAALRVDRPDRFVGGLDVA